MIIHVTGFSGSEQTMDRFQSALEALPGIERARITPLEHHEWKGTTDIWTIALQGTDAGVDEVLRDFGASPVPQGELLPQDEERLS
jgi:hypothetical protein